MSKFKCLNPDCKNFNKSVEVDNAYWTWHYKGVYPSQEQKNKDIECKICKHLMSKHIRDIKSSDAPNYLRFDSLSHEEKSRILAKRAANAYKREGQAEIKLHKQRETIKKALGGL
jgi:hypothetical protein